MLKPSEIWGEENLCDHDTQEWEMDGQGEGYCKKCEQEKLLNDENI